MIFLIPIDEIKCLLFTVKVSWTNHPFGDIEYLKNDLTKQRSNCKSQKEDLF
jgi:hypothetical protein